MNSEKNVIEALYPHIIQGIPFQEPSGWTFLGITVAQNVEIQPVLILVLEHDEGLT